MAQNRVKKSTSKTKVPVKKTQAKKSLVQSDPKETKPTKNEKESQLKPYEELLQATEKFLMAHGSSQMSIVQGKCLM